MCNRMSAWDVEEEGKEPCSVAAHASAHMHRFTDEKSSQQQCRTGRNELFSFLQMVQIPKALGCVYTCVG